MIAQHPSCHVWQVFLAVERSNMQSWSPLDVGQPAPGLGGGGGGGGKGGKGMGKGKEGKGKRESLQYAVSKRKHPAEPCESSPCTVPH